MSVLKKDTRSADPRPVWTLLSLFAILQKKTAGFERFITSDKAHISLCDEADFT